MVKLLKISHFAVTEPLIAMPILVMFLVHQGDSSSCWGRDSEGGISLLYHHLYFRSFNLSYSHSISFRQQPFLLLRDEDMHHDHKQPSPFLYPSFAGESLMPPDICPAYIIPNLLFLNNHNYQD